VLRGSLAAAVAATLNTSLTGCSDISATADEQARDLLRLPEIDTSDGLRLDGELVADRELYEAARNGTLVLYSGTGKEAEDLAVARFEEITGIGVELTRLPTNKLAERVLSEHGAGQTSAEVIRITDPRVARQLEEAGVFAPYRTPFHDRLAADNAVPSDAFWYGYNFVAAIGYNSALITEDPPRRWQDLTDPRFEGEFGVVAITTGGTLAALARMQIELFGPEFLQGQGRLEPRIFDSTSTQVDALARGEITVGTVSFNNTFAAQYAGAPIELVIPDEGTSGCPGPLGLTRKGVESPAAQVFANWAMSGEGQKFSAAQGFVPVRTDIPAIASGAYQLPAVDSPRFHLMTEEKFARYAPEDEEVWRQAFHFIG
jgi:iron(III) transport system substrate-binding protein